MIHLGTDYEKTNDSKVYRFVTKRIIATPLPFFHRNAAFCDSSGRVWATIEEGILYISQGYAWNGCSPKRKVLGIWIGTPDTASNVHASLLVKRLVHRLEAARARNRVVPREPRCDFSCVRNG